MDRALLPGHKSGMLDSAVRVQSGRRPKIKKKEANEGADIVQTSSSASDPPPSLSLSRPSTLPPSNPRVLYRQNGNPLERFASLLLPWNLLESLRLHQEATFSSFSHALPPPLLFLLLLQLLLLQIRLLRQSCNRFQLISTAPCIIIACGSHWLWRKLRYITHHPQITHTLYFIHRIYIYIYIYSFTEPHLIFNI